jgi:hypothetical protein
MIIADMCREFGWTVEYVLAMPVQRMFVLRKAIIDSRIEEQVLSLVDQCDIQAISIGDSKYYSELRSHYAMRLPGSRQHKDNLRLFDPTNRADMNVVVSVMGDAFRQMRRLQGLG